MHSRRLFLSSFDLSPCLRIVQLSMHGGRIIWFWKVLHRSLLESILRDFIVSPAWNFMEVSESPSYIFVVFQAIP
jgi:hypothetical protein